MIDSDDFFYQAILVFYTNYCSHLIVDEKIKFICVLLCKSRYVKALYVENVQLKKIKYKGFNFYI